MFFFNGRIRNPNIVPMVNQDRPYTNKVGQSGIIIACLSIIIGLILIVIGTISETEKTTFFGVGIISLGVGFSVTTIVCFHTKLNICYHNWAYRSHITPSNLENSQLTTARHISMSILTGTPTMTQNIRTITSPIEPATKLSNVKTKKVTISPLIGIHKTNTHNVS